VKRLGGKSSAYSGALSYYTTEGLSASFNDNSDNLSTAGRLDYHLDDDTVIRRLSRVTRWRTSALPAFFSIASGTAGAVL